MTFSLSKWQSMLTGRILRINHVCNLNRLDVLTLLIYLCNFTKIKNNLRKQKRKREFNYLHGKGL